MWTNSLDSTETIDGLKSIPLRHYIIAMIKFSLRCNHDHNFDSWFMSSEAFEKLKASGMLSCPVCGSSKVKKNIMTPQVQSLSTRRKDTEEKSESPPPSIPITRAMQKWQELQKLIDKTFDHVGDNFVTEVRAMDAGEIPKRSVIGDASINDAIELLEDGIPVAPVPWIDKRKAN